MTAGERLRNIGFFGESDFDEIMKNLGYKIDRNIETSDVDRVIYFDHESFSHMLPTIGNNINEKVIVGVSTGKITKQRIKKILAKQKLEQAKYAVLTSNHNSTESFVKSNAQQGLYFWDRKYMLFYSVKANLIGFYNQILKYYSKKNVLFRETEIDINWKTLIINLQSGEFIVYLFHSEDIQLLIEQITEIIDKLLEVRFFPLIEDHDFFKIKIRLKILTVGRSQIKNSDFEDYIEKLYSEKIFIKPIGKIVRSVQDTPYGTIAENLIDEIPEMFKPAHEK